MNLLEQLGNRSPTKLMRHLCSDAAQDRSRKSLAKAVPKHAPTVMVGLTAPPTRSPSRAEGQQRRRRPNLCRKAPSLRARYLTPGQLRHFNGSTREGGFVHEGARQPATFQLFLDDPSTWLLHDGAPTSTKLDEPCGLTAA